MARFHLGWRGSRSVVRGVLLSGLLGAGMLPLAVQASALPIQTAVLSSAACLPLGPATTYNTFILGNIDQSGSDTEGRLAAGGTATLAHYSVGAGLAASAQPVLVVGGHLTFTAGAIAGIAVVGGGESVSDVTFTNDGRVQAGSPVDFAAAGAALRAASLSAGQLAVNGTAQLAAGQLLLAGTDAQLDVFRLPAATLSAAHSVTIRVPAAATVLVNVSGSSVSVQSLGFTLVGASADHVLFNLPQATTLTLAAVGVPGSVLAPQAAISFNNGHFLGTLVGASLQGSGEADLPAGQANSAPFAGCLTAAVLPSSPTATASATSSPATASPTVAMATATPATARSGVVSTATPTVGPAPAPVIAAVASPAPTATAGVAGASTTTPPVRAAATATSTATVTSNVAAATATARPLLAAVGAGVQTAPSPTPAPAVGTAPTAGAVSAVLGAQGPLPAGTYPTLPQTGGGGAAGDPLLALVHAVLCVTTPAVTWLSSGGR